MPADLGWPALALLLLAAFAAGWLDAIGGGGGLIQLPMLLLVLPANLTPVALGTNKVSSIIGTTAAATTYARRLPPPLKTAAPMMGAAFLASLAGSSLASSVDPVSFRPVILVMLVIVFVITLSKRSLSAATLADHETPTHGLLLPIAIGAGIGFYDGLIGPGTGAFLLVALVQLAGFSFLRASSTAKFVNWSTNLASIIIFGAFGSILWSLGLAMGAANLGGGLLGSRMALARGSGFVRGLLLAAVALLIVRLAWSLVG